MAFNIGDRVKYTDGILFTGLVVAKDTEVVPDDTSFVMLDDQFANIIERKLDTELEAE